MESLLSKAGDHETEPGVENEDAEEKPQSENRAYAGFRITPHFTGLSFASGGLRRACEDAHAESDEARGFLNRLADEDDGGLQEIPEPNVSFECPGKDCAYALIAWKRSRIAIFERAEYRFLCEIAESDKPEVEGWLLLIAEETDAAELLALFPDEG